MIAATLDMPVAAVERGTRIFLAADVLQWDGATGDEIHGDFVLLLGEQLGAILAAGPPDRSQLLRDALAALTDTGWARLITAPRASYHLLWPSRHSAAESTEFLLNAALIEQARERGPAGPETTGFPGDDQRWSALGDGWLDVDGRFVAGVAIDRFPPIDFASPHALAIDIEGEVDEVDDQRVPIEAAQRDALVVRFNDVRDRLTATDPALSRFVHAFTKVLVPQRDPLAPALFSTGSSAQYVGRSVLGNPDLAKVDSALLADGLVHEAIHSLLYMSERLEPWVNCEAQYGPEHRTRSPWTGNPLPLRSYLQACFVWYGLATFWARALSSGSFPADTARRRLEQSVGGFLQGHVLDQVREFSDGINPEVLEAIDGLQGGILAAI